MRSGRRPGPTQTRQDILDAAGRLFAEKGYDGATVRDIAAAAGVNPALVHHFFGPKEKVFTAALGLPFTPAEVLPTVLDGPRDEVGERIVRMVLAVWRDPAGRAPLLALIRSAATNEQAAQMVREFFGAALFDRVAATLDVPRLRVTAAAAQILGMAMLRYVLQVEPLASADEQEVVALLAPAVQRFIDGEPAPC